MKKAIICGAGRKYKSNRMYYEKKFDIVGVVDNSWKKIGNSIHPVEWVAGVKYDLIIITPVKYDNYMQLYHQLLMLGVPKEKILFTFCNPDNFAHYSLGYRYYGQHCEDLVLAAIFARLDISRPSYIDLGSNHPFLYSNTALMYERGGRGINVDANRESIEMFNIVRPDDINLNVGVASEEGEMSFYLVDKTSGLNSLSIEEIRRFDVEIKEIRNIRVVTLKTIVNQYCPNEFPDFLDCDIEGADYDVLYTYDLQFNGPKVICVEVRATDIDEFDEMLNSKGYFRFCRIGENNIYVRNEFSKVLRHLDI